MVLFSQLQVLKSLRGVIHKNLIKSEKDKDMNSKADIIKDQMNNLYIFVKRAIKEDQTVLHTAARDMSFILVHLYVGRYYTLATLEAL
jgi:hypothetical protein